MKASLLLALLLAASAPLHAQQRGQQNPFAPPAASLHYAPDRTCDLQNVVVDIDVDYPNKKIAGKVALTMSPLRNGITDVVLMAGGGIEISKVTVDGAAAKYTRDGKDLHIATRPLTKGKPIQIAIEYTEENARGRTFGAGGGGWHWIQAQEANQNHVGFWTQGETGFNSEWVPLWDYPNDFATTETRTTVPSDWTVVGNGVLVGTTLSADKTRKTFDWKMTQPHATYLLSLVGGPFDIKRDTWEGVDLWYVVPKGQGAYIDDSFGHTKDMLSFFSKTVGFKYAWPKYAQNAMFDFGGGMENVSATTLGEGALTEARAGYFDMDSVNSHELGHQWFGDLVTCRFWGDIWLNESFATFMQLIYFEHSRGETGYQWEVDGAINSYLREARRYQRPLSTHMYPNDDAMFDSHTYPKGGAILHTLRRWLGDENFFAGIKLYLEKWQHTPVENSQLRLAMSEATGINLEPFWEQWILKPGHPVIDYTWTWKPDGAESGPGKILLTVKQTQDTSNGTPIYAIDAKVGYVRAGLASTGFQIAPIHLSKAEETFEIPSPTRALAVVLDPNHDFLCDIPTLLWTPQELPLILTHSTNAPDRQVAMGMMLQGGSPSAETLSVITKEVAADRDPRALVFRNLNALVNLADPSLRSFWMGQLDNPNMDRQATAVQALAKLPQDPATTQKLRSLINDQAPIGVVISAINALANWDKAGNADVFKKAQSIPDRRGRIKRAADSALGIP